MIILTIYGLFHYALSLTRIRLTHFAYVRTQLDAPVKAVQCDNGKEFDNSSARTFFLTNGIHLRMSCPYTSAQNGKAERIIRTTNNIIRSLLFQASAPPSFWVEALHTATHLLNILPTKTLELSTPHEALFGSSPTYEHLRVFGCKCYPNLTATAPHKLAPRSALCVFLGYSAHHKGYRCLDLATNKVIISRHVIFDEAAFPFAEQSPAITPADLDFLDITDHMPAPIGLSYPLPAGTSGHSAGSSPSLAERAPPAPVSHSATSAAAPPLTPIAPSTAGAPAHPRAASTPGVPA